MKKSSILLLILMSLIAIISCKKTTNKSTTKIEVLETISKTGDTTAIPEQKYKTSDSVAIEIIKKNDITKTIQEVENKVTKNETSTIKKTEEIVSKETEQVKEIIESVEEITTTVKEETEVIVEKAQTKTENVKIEAEPVKEVIKEVTKQLTNTEKIAHGKILFTTGICKNCHHQSKKMIGPSLVRIGSIYKKKNGSIVTFLKGNGKPIVEPKKFKMMKPNIDDVTRHMPLQDLEALEAYILSFAK